MAWKRSSVRSRSGPPNNPFTGKDMQEVRRSLLPMTLCHLVYGRRRLVPLLTTAPVEANFPESEDFRTRLRLLSRRLLTQIERILKVNDVPAITKEVGVAAREASSSARVDSEPAYTEIALKVCATLRPSEFRASTWFPSWPANSARRRLRVRNRG